MSGRVYMGPLGSTQDVIGGGGGGGGLQSVYGETTLGAFPGDLAEHVVIAPLAVVLVVPTVVLYDLSARFFVPAPSGVELQCQARVTLGVLGSVLFGATIPPGAANRIVEINGTGSSPGPVPPGAYAIGLTVASETALECNTVPNPFPPLFQAGVFSSLRVFWGA